MQAIQTLVERLLRRAVGNRAVANAMLGDLEEERARIAAERGRGVADRWYVRTVLGIAAHARWTRVRRPRAFAPPRPPGDPFMSEIWRDARFALRSLAKRPAFAITVILTLAVGLAANVVVFAVLDGLVLRPFPLADVDRVIQVFGRQPEGGTFGDRSGVSPADFLDYRRQTTGAELIGLEWWDATVTGRTEPERVQAFRVSPAFFDALGVKPTLGRFLHGDEGTRGRHRVAVIGHGFWQRRFAGDAAIVGQSILIDGEPYTVAGIGPKDFEFPVGSEVWAPLAFEAETERVRHAHYLRVLGRLRDGATVDTVRGELTAIAARLAQAHPDTNRGWSVNVMALDEAIIDIGIKPFLAVWQGSALLILLMACVNVANLLLARGAGRHRELALRAALGASRRTLIRQLLVESLVLAMSGALLAIPFAMGALTVVRAAMPAHIARFVGGWREIDIDGRFLVALVALAAVTALVFGLLPALRASRTSLVDTMRDGGRSVAGTRGHLRHGLVSIEVALALTLLVAAGLSLRSTLHILTRDDGYDPTGVMTMRVSLPPTKYADDADRRRFHEALLREARQRPGVDAAALTNIVPAAGDNESRTIEVEGQAADAGAKPTADYRAVSPELFGTLRIAIIRGRGFDTRDGEDGRRVAIVSERMAQRLWPGEDAIGRRFRVAAPNAPWREVVGIARDVRHDWFMNRMDPTFYVPMAQAPSGDVTLVLKTAGDPAALAAEGRRAVLAVDPDQPVYEVRTLRQVRQDKALGLRYAAGFMGSMGLVGLLLAAVGVYGVMAYAVGSRTQEIGIRLALGASRTAVLSSTVGRALAFAGAGLGVGFLGAYALGRTMEQLLFGGVELDVASFVVFPLLLSGIALLASVVPARRALRVDPAVTLRSE